jgi:hypothetical protein
VFGQGTLHALARSATITQVQAHGPRAGCVRPGHPARPRPQRHHHAGASARPQSWLCTARAPCTPSPAAPPSRRCKRPAPELAVYGPGTLHALARSATVTQVQAAGSKAGCVQPGAKALKCYGVTEANTTAFSLVSLFIHFAKLLTHLEVVFVSIISFV